MEALTDDEAGLTYPALVGSRKQSVEDAERLFSPSLLKFMEKKGIRTKQNILVLYWGGGKRVMSVISLHWKGVDVIMCS